MKRLFEKLLSAAAIGAIATSALAVKINVTDINNFNAAVNALISAGGTGVPTSRLISTTSGQLTGGGDLSADRTLGLATTAVSAGSYGDATHTGTFTVDAMGRLTAASAAAITFPSTITGNAGTATKLATARTIDTLTGDVTTPGCSFDGSANCTGAATLASVGTAGTYGDATHIPSVTTDAKGRVTGVTLNAISIPTGTLLAANNLSDVANVTTSRTNLGLGTAAVANTGTSGHTVPYLDTADVFSANLSVNVTGAAATMAVVGDGVSQAQVQSYTANATGSNFFVQKGRGTQAAPTNLLMGDQPGQFVFQGYGGGGFRTAAKISANIVEPTPSATAMGSNLIFYTAPIGAITALPALTIQSDQSVTFANTVNLPVAAITTDAGATYTLAASASYTQMLTAPITANRSVTLPTTTQTGQVFRFVRAVASTGAFTWSIGGLKSLAAGTWCDVQWNGSAWTEIAYGSL